MRVLRSRAEPGLTHVLLTDADVKLLRAALKKKETPWTQTLRRALKSALNASS